MSPPRHAPGPGLLSILLPLSVALACAATEPANDLGGDASGGSGIVDSGTNSSASESTGGDDDSHSEGGGTFDPAACGLPVAELRRLSRRQYTNTIYDLLNALDLEPTDNQTAALRDALERLPADRRARASNQPGGGFRHLDQDVQQGHIDAGYGIAGPLPRSWPNHHNRYWPSRRAAARTTGAATVSNP